MTLGQVLGLLLLGFVGGIITVLAATLATIAWFWFADRKQEEEFSRVMREAMTSAPHVLEVE